MNTAQWQPSRAALEKALAELEGGHTGLAFASGLGAMTTVLELLEAGSEVVAMTIYMVAPGVCLSR
jgi:cystathionine beta-lyase/cystathionine gamma-synthase